MLRFSLAVSLATSTASPAFAEPSCGLYQYKAVITEVYDGDTVTADIDLGFHTWRRDEKLRLYGINTPELRGVSDQEKQRGYAARDALRERILGKEVVICTIKDRTGADSRGKYGRYLAKVYLGDELLNDWLVAEGHAVHHEY